MSQTLCARKANYSWLISQTDAKLRLINVNTNDAIVAHLAKRGRLFDEAEDVLRRGDVVHRQRRVVRTQHGQGGSQTLGLLRKITRGKIVIFL